MSSESQELGPQYDRDDPFTARMRRHQSWYRSQVLRVPFGTGPKRSSTEYYGSMLAEEAAERGLNFLTPEIFEVYKRRAGPGVEPFRCTRNMLSSQPMCFNLFAPLVDDLDLAGRLLRAILGPDHLDRVTSVRIEYSPRPAKEFLSDRTSFDAFVEYLSRTGEKNFIGIETKLTDSFSPTEYETPTYTRLTQNDESPWKPEAWPLLKGTETNQLWRNHLLGEAIRRHAKAPHGTAGRLGVVYHPLDGSADGALAQYRTYLRDPTSAFLDMRLDRLLELWMSAVRSETEEEWLNKFRTRYLDLRLSE